MSSTTAETPIAGAAAAAAAEDGGAGGSPASPSQSQPQSPASARAVPSGVTVVFAERKRTGRIAGAKYKADGTPYKRPGPPPKPIEERAHYQARGPLKRMERSYTDQKRREVVMFLQNHKIRVTDENDIRARKGWNGGREDQQPPEEPGYRWPTLKETSDWFKVPERTVHSWWKRRQKILGNAPKKLTKAEKRRMAEEEERRRKEAEERREQLSAIGWPTEALPEVIPGYEGAWQRASEDVRMQIQGLPQPEAGEMSSRATAWSVAAATFSQGLPPVSPAPRAVLPVSQSPAPRAPPPVSQPPAPHVLLPASQSPAPRMLLPASQSPAPRVLLPAPPRTENISAVTRTPSPTTDASVPSSTTATPAAIRETTEEREQLNILAREAMAASAGSTPAA
ncbi:purine-cytosine permease fcy22 [Colletotrichum chrysophilum]|uniref:Purine-cytosine permease fcy22 n=1 Tax=Colletotrichum chrysophilum TaxID=1836956 RepID=A0AAD9A3K3_9PEZI|nr:purine-cytosine permease fcy22 [Colletotrichum chrysophilum]